MKVLAWPAFRRRGYTSFLYSEVRQHGIVVEEFSPFRLLRGRYDIIHIHWPEMAFLHPNLAKASIGSFALIVLLRIARRRGARVIWTVHNLEAHERLRPRLEGIFWRLFTRALDGYITLTNRGGALARSRYSALGRCAGFVIPLGHYRDVYPNEISRSDARTRLGIANNAVVMTFVGRIRTYKNVPHLIRVFRAGAEGNDALVVAGRPQSEELVAQIREAAADDSRVHLFLGFIPDEDFQLYLNAADLVVLPFTRILNSASALLALSYDRPVLLPSIGALSELREQVGDEWVRTFNDELDSLTLRDASQWARRPGRIESPRLDRFAWAELARQTVQAYRDVRRPAIGPVNDL